MPFAEVNQTRLFYTDDGQGQALFFIHGLGATHAMFEPQVPFFSQHYHVICPDMRGCGQSGKLTGPVSTVLDRQSDDIAALMDDLGIEKAVFCGVSYGGVFCFHFVLRYPERVAALIISDSFGDTWWVGVPEALLMIAQYANLWAMYLPGSWLVPLVKKQYERWPLAQRHVSEITRSMRNHEAVLQRLAINQADHTRDLPGVRCPALGIVGGSSEILVRYMRRAMNAIPIARLEVVPNSFDPTNLCQPETYNRLVIGFLQEIHY